MTGELKELDCNTYPELLGTSFTEELSLYFNLLGRMEMELLSHYYTNYEEMKENWQKFIEK